MLVAELKELHPGRGVRRPDVRSWLGENLQRFAGVTPEVSDEDARMALVALLGRHLARFPADLRQLFRVASGIAADQPFLEDRLAAYGKSAERSTRALRRHLRQAEQLIADSLLQEFDTQTGSLESRGWQWVSHDFDLALSDGAVLTLDRVLLALADHQKFVQESFFVAGPWSADDRLEVEALSGARLVVADGSISGRWDLILELPHELKRGQELQIVLRVTLSRARALGPFLALAPLRPSRSVRTSVHFGTPPVADRAWLIEAELPMSVTLSDPSRRLLDLTHPNVSVTFANPRVGLAYGIGWEWPAG